MVSIKGLVAMFWGYTTGSRARGLSEVIQVCQAGKYTELLESLKHKNRCKISLLINVKCTLLVKKRGFKSN